MENSAFISRGKLDEILQEQKKKEAEYMDSIKRYREEIKAANEYIERYYIMCIYKIHTCFYNHFLFVCLFAHICVVGTHKTRQ